MKQSLIFPVVLLCCLGTALLAPARPVGAFPNSQARVQFHLTRPDLTASCGDLDPSAVSSSELRLKGIGGPWQIWVLVTETQGLGGVSFQMSADPGVQIVSWQSCGDMQFPVGAWPHSGSSISVVWAECRKPANGIVPVGFFVVEENSEGVIRIGPHESFNEIQLSDCLFHVDAVPDTCTAAAAVWPDSTRYQIHGLAWRPAKERPAPAEPDSVVLAREVAARRKQTMPEPEFPAAGSDSSLAPADADSTRGRDAER